MNSKGRRMTDEHIQCAAVFDAVRQQLWNHTESAEVGICLGVLVCAVGSVPDAATKAADQSIFNVGSFQVQVEAAFSPCTLICLVVFRVVVARHVVHRHVEHGDDVFQIRVRQVSASENQPHLLKVSARDQGVHAVNDLVAYR